METGKSQNERTTTLAMAPWSGYMVAIVGTALAALFTWLFPASATANLPLYLMFYPVVFAAAVMGGTGPGLLATILGGLAANVCFLLHGGRLEFGTTSQTVRLALFLATNVAISLLGG